VPPVVRVAGLGAHESLFLSRLLGVVPRRAWVAKVGQFFIAVAIELVLLPYPSRHVCQTPLVNATNPQGVQLEAVATHVF